MPKVVMFKMTDIASSAAAAVNVTDAMLTSKSVASDIILASKSIQSVGGMCSDYSGNLYISDYEQHVIMKLSEGGKLSIVAGVAGSSGNNSALQNVTTSDARFNTPMGLACDHTGNIYVADSGNNQIRLINNGRVSVLAGNGAASGAGGAGFVDTLKDPLTSKFFAPYGVAVDNSGNVFVADTGNNAIRKIWRGQVLTIAGGVAGDSENVKASKIAGANAIFSSPTAIDVDGIGNIFVCDYNNKKIKKITPNGWVYLFSGSGSAGHALGTGSTPAYTCTYNALSAIKCEKSGYIYVLDMDSVTAYSRLLRLTPFGVPSEVRDFHITTTAYRSFRPGGLAVSPAQKIFVTLTAVEEIASSSSSSSSSSVDSSSSSSEEYSESSSSSSEEYSESSSSSSE